MEFHAKNKLDDKTEMLIQNIIGAAIDVHRELGPGYLEKVYEEAMSLELRQRGLAYATQVPIAVSDLLILMIFNETIFHKNKDSGITL